MDPTTIVPVAVARRRYPQLERLIDLIEARWLFMNQCDDIGQAVQIDGFRCWPDMVTDTICIRSDTDAKGCRTLGDEYDIVAEFTGTLDDVVNALLALPAPNAPNAPRLVKGTAPRRLWTP